MTVELYSKPGCVGCRQSEKRFALNNIAYTKLDITVDDAARAVVVDELGFMAAPVVVVRNADGSIADAWSGYNVDKINALA